MEMQAKMITLIRKWKRRALILLTRRLLEMFPDEVLIPPGYHVHKNPRRIGKRNSHQQGFPDLII